MPDNSFIDHILKKRNKSSTQISIKKTLKQPTIAKTISKIDKSLESLSKSGVSKDTITTSLLNNDSAAAASAKAESEVTSSLPSKNQVGENEHSKSSTNVQENKRKIRDPANSESKVGVRSFSKRPIIADSIGSKKRKAKTNDAAKLHFGSDIPQKSNEQNAKSQINKHSGKNDS